MGREVRKVPADWQHPKYPDDHYEPHRQGRYIPLSDFSFAEADAEWSAGYELWQRGLYIRYGSDEPQPIPAEYAGMRWTEYHGPRPSPDDYMPDWPAEQRTHLMMYEDTSEGTPISPAFETPEELARWLADNGASAFANETASYEAWLSVARGGWAPSMILTSAGLQSGVAALAGHATTPPRVGEAPATELKTEAPTTAGEE